MPLLNLNIIRLSQGLKRRADSFCPNESRYSPPQGVHLMKSSEGRGKGHLEAEKGLLEVGHEMALQLLDCTISADLTLPGLTKVNVHQRKCAKAVAFGQRDDCSSAIKPPGLTLALCLSSQTPQRDCNSDYCDTHNLGLNWTQSNHCWHHVCVSNLACRNWN